MHASNSVRIYGIALVLTVLVVLSHMSSLNASSLKYYRVDISIYATFPDNSFQSWLINPIVSFQNISNEYFSQSVHIDRFILNINGETFGNYVLTNDRDNNTLISINQIPKEINSTTYMISNVSYSIFVTSKKVPDLNMSKAGGLDDIPKQLINSIYLGFNDAWLNDSDVKMLAFSMLNKSNVLDTVLRYSSWIDENILYPVNPPHLEPWNSTSVFRHREGDCDDRAILLISMLRSVGIPAYLQVGSIYMSGNNSTEKFNNLYYELINTGWHGWAMVYIPPWGFLPVDLTYFKDASINYVKINNSTYLKITAKNPLSHIIGAALFTSTVFVASSIIASDYIKPSYEWFRTVLNNNIVWREKDEIHEVLYEDELQSYTLTENKETFMSPIISVQNLNMFMVLSLIFLVMFVFIFIYIRKRFIYT
ncbi:MAG: transglutaminase-like domain-containing protein [Thermoprotei archaeon]